MKHHLGIDISKDIREVFMKGNTSDVVEKFDELMQYCANDVLVTHQLFQVLFPKYLSHCPHPVSFAGMLEMGKSFLTLTSEWDDFVESSENLFVSDTTEIEEKLCEIADEYLQLIESEKWKDDPWLQVLDWSLVSTKSKILPGKPKWYRELWDSKAQKIKIRTGKRITPYLLKLEWKGFPLVWNAKYGWTFRVPVTADFKSENPPLIFPDNPDEKGYDPRFVSDNGNFLYYPIPHKDGENHNCGNPLSKPYMKAFEQGILTSSYPAAKKILEKSSRCSYWGSTRKRVKDQLVITLDSNTVPEHYMAPIKDENGNPISVILPLVKVMGTVTRRAVESTWLTAANAKSKIIGSELKSQVRAPDGYVIVGADVDSEELWISSLLGDAQFGIHGSTPMGFMTLQGSKEARTDLHTRTGDIVGISRDVAKIFNYSRIYGAGQNHATQLLMQNSLGIDRQHAKQMASKLFKETKGVRIHGGSQPYWSGGSESFMFNSLENIAIANISKTPCLECIIPESLLTENCGNEVRSHYILCRI